MSVLDLNAAKRHLNITDEKSDTDLQAMIDAAEQVLAERVGPLVSTTKTDRVNISGGYSFTLRTTPVISLTSATSIYGSSTADVSQLHVSPSGVVTWGDGISRFYWGDYDVVYQAGYATVPPAILFAIKEQLRHMWSSRRGPAGRGTASADMPGYLIPNVVASAIEPYVQEFGFA